MSERERTRPALMVVADAGRQTSPGADPAATRNRKPLLLPKHQITVVFSRHGSAHARRADVSAPTGVPMAASALPTKPVGVIAAHNNPVAAALFREHPRTVRRPWRRTITTQ